MSTFENSQQFIWTKFYKEFATKLLQYKDNRSGLLNAIYSMPSFAQFNQSYQDIYNNNNDEKERLRDICPFTVFGIFNRGITMDNRINLANDFRYFLELSEASPTSFDGIPILNNQRSWFFRFEKSRKVDDIDKLWNVFEQAIIYADSHNEDKRTNFINSYDHALKINGVAWNLTIGLFWIRPYFYPTLDTKSLHYITSNRLSLLVEKKAQKKAQKPFTGEEYTTIAKELKSLAFSNKSSFHSLPELSYNAYNVVSGEPVPPFEENEQLKKGDKTLKEKSFSKHKLPLNQIFYGPPGTGKTYKTINATLEILSPEFANIDDRNKQKKEFDKFLNMGKVKFVTFHQSYSYEDFVEGIRPVISDDDEDKVGNISYAVHDGIFKEICESAQARTVKSSQPIQDVENKQIWKMSLGDSYKDRDTYTYCLKNNKVLMGYGWSNNFSGQLTREEISLRLENEDRTNDLITGMVYNFSQKMKKGDIIVVPEGLTKIRAIAEIVSDYEYFTQEDVTNHKGHTYRQSRSVRWLCQFDPPMPVTNLQEKQFSQLTLYSLSLNEKEKQNLKSIISPQDEKKIENYVLIIDEINRGNISAIFGELITLIEPSKRLGESEELKAVLPYSRESFAVPNNLYIIGTMNSADRSLTGLDIALRRRFSFVEMPPQPQLLMNRYIQGTDISLEVVLESMNKRIEVLLGRDYCIGHAAFMHLDESVSVEELKGIFQGTVIPLLQEYFFEDWNKIHLVLNDHKKENEFRFIRKKELSSFSNDNEFSNFNKEIWEINNEVFDRLESYVGIVNPTYKVIPKKIHSLSNEVGLPDFAKIENFKSTKKYFQDEKYYILQYENTEGGINYKIYINGIEAINTNKDSTMTQTQAAEEVIEKYKLNIERHNKNGEKKVPNALISEILQQIRK